MVLLFFWENRKKRTSSSPIIQWAKHPEARRHPRPPSIGPPLHLSAGAPSTLAHLGFAVIYFSPSPLHLSIFNKSVQSTYKYVLLGPILKKKKTLYPIFPFAVMGSSCFSTHLYSEHFHSCWISMSLTCMESPFLLKGRFWFSKYWVEREILNI